MPINDMLLSRACMAESFSSGIDLPSPILSARLRELASFLAAPSAGRLTEEQRALALGIARRLVADVAAELDPAIDGAALWQDWFAAGVPAAERITTVCFGRAEEHRWREQSAQRVGTPPPLAEGNDEAPAASPISDVDRAYLALRIADRRRFDAYGSPRVALADIPVGLLRTLLLDIAGWRLAQVAKDKKLAADLGEAVRDATDRLATASGIDAAARLYHDRLAEQGDLAAAATSAIARHDWAAFVALASAAGRNRFDEMALALLSSAAAALPILLAPLKLDRASLAPLEASLAMLPARAVDGGGAGD